MTKRPKRVMEESPIDPARARIRLEARRQALIEDANEQAGRLQDGVAIAQSRTLGGDSDDTVYAVERDKVITNAERAVAELRAIERALEAIENGTWGTCANCGRLIEADRLIVRPESVWCVSCRSREETQSAHGDSTPSI